MQANRLDPLADLLAHARRIINQARAGGAPPPFDDLVDHAAAALLVAMAFWHVARDLDLRATAAAVAAQVAGLAEAVRDGLADTDVEAALAALESLLVRTSADKGASA